MGGRLKAGLLLLVMFGAGFLTSMTWMHHRQGQLPFQSDYPEARMQRLQQALKLNPDQARALENIFEQAHQRAAELNSELAWDLAEIHRDSLGEVRKILSSEQFAKFESMRKKSLKHKPEQKVVAARPKP